MKKKYYWIVVIVVVMIIIFSLGIVYTLSVSCLGCGPGESAREQTEWATQAMECCSECIEAFQNSPIAVDPEMTNCIDFAESGTSEEFFLSEECKTFFQNNPQLSKVSNCSG